MIAETATPPVTHPCGEAAPPLPAARAGDAWQASVAFPLGLPGFPDVRVVEVRLQPTPIGRQGLILGRGEPPVALRVLAPRHPLALYRAADLEAIVATEALQDGRAILLLVVRPMDGKGLVVNLRAPVIIDMHTLTGAQQVLPNSAYPVRAPLGSV
jgi:flagellar assembly factor FliW